MRFLSLSVYSTKVIFLLRKISLLIRRFNVDYALGCQYDEAPAGGGWEGKKKKGAGRESLAIPLNFARKKRQNKEKNQYSPGRL